MANLSGVTLQTPRGVLILEEFQIGLETHKFLEVACPDPVPMDIRWRVPREGRGNDVGVHRGMSRLIVSERQVETFLYVLPSGLPFDFALSDLEFPVEIVGCILIVNLNIACFMLTDDKGRLKKIPKIARAIQRIWIDEQRLPFVVVTTGYESPALTESQIRDSMYLDPDITIVPCPAGLDKVIAERALTRLLEQISTHGADR